MRQIIRQAIPIQRVVSLALPSSAQLLSVCVDNGSVWLYILVEDSRTGRNPASPPKEQRDLWILPTDQWMYDEQPLRFIGTIHPKGYQEAYHVFEVIRDE